MFVGCSEISITFIVKHDQYIRVIKTFYMHGDLLSFSVPVGAEKLAGLWFARVISIQVWN